MIIPNGNLAGLGQYRPGLFQIIFISSFSVEFPNCVVVLKLPIACNGMESRTSRHFQKTIRIVLRNLLQQSINRCDNIIRSVCDILVKKRFLFQQIISCMSVDNTKQSGNTIVQNRAFLFRQDLWFYFFLKEVINPFRQH